MLGFLATAGKAIIDSYKTIVGLGETLVAIIAFRVGGGEKNSPLSAQRILRAFSCYGCCLAGIIIRQTGDGVLGRAARGARCCLARIAANDRPSPHMRRDFNGFQGCRDRLRNGNERRCAGYPDSNRTPRRTAFCHPSRTDPKQLGRKNLAFEKACSIL